MYAYGQGVSVNVKIYVDGEISLAEAGLSV